MKGSRVLFQGFIILLLVSNLTMNLGGSMSAIADGMPSAGMPSVSPTVRNAPANRIANTTTKLPSTVANAVRKDLSKQTGIPASKLQLVQSTSKTWSDGCLGLAKADEMCTQAMIQGWQVTFSNGTQRWIYRTDATGRVYRMEKPAT